MNKPDNIVYGLDDRPPLVITILGGLQNVAVMAIYLVLPLTICLEANVPLTTTAHVLTMSFVVMAVTMLLQVWRGRWFGSGYMCPPTFSGIYFSPSLAAAGIGGLPLVFGMTAFAGLIQAGLSQYMHRLRPYFPAEIAGLIVLLVGITNAVVGTGYLVDIDMSSDQEELNHLLVAALTLITMVALNIWTKGTLRLLCALIGLVVGYVAAAATGLLVMNQALTGPEVPYFALPRFDHLEWTFDIALAPPFIVAGVAAALKTTAVVSVCQRINDADWIRPNLQNIRKGVMGDGIGTTVAGVLGTFGVNPSPGCVGLSAATGITSRIVAYAIAAIFLAAAFFPKAALAFAVMPKAVIGAALIFTACLLITSGIQTIAARMLDNRKTFIVGLAVVSAVAVELHPEMSESVPSLLQPIVSSPLVLGTLLAFLLNILFRIGLKQRVLFDFNPMEEDGTVLDDFVNEYGGKWGARRDVMARFGFALQQSVEAVNDHCDVSGPLRIEASYDEFNLHLALSYEGDLLEFPDHRPTDEEIGDSLDGMRRMAGFLLGQTADRVRSEHSGGTATIRFDFEN